MSPAGWFHFSNALNSKFKLIRGYPRHRVPAPSSVYGKNARVTRYLFLFCIYYNKYLLHHKLHNTDDSRGSSLLETIRSTHLVLVVIFPPSIHIFPVFPVTNDQVSPLFSSSSKSHVKPMGLHATILPVVTKDIPSSPWFTPYDLLSRCKFSTPATRQPMVAFYSLAFSRFPLQKEKHKFW